MTHHGVERSDERRPVQVLEEVRRGMLGLGVYWRPAFRAAGLAPELIEDPEATISESSVMQLFALLPEITSDPGIGLHVADHVDPRASNIVDYLLISSPTVRLGIERVVRTVA